MTTTCTTMLMMITMMIMTTLMTMQIGQGSFGDIYAGACAAWLPEPSKELLTQSVCVQA
jgi:hypothetical protein